MKRFLSFSIAFSFAALAAPALEWETTSLSLRTAPLQKTTEAAFVFTNTGDKAVTITGVDSSCDCLEATPSAKTFAPGAGGRIHARFSIGDRTGLLRRTIIVSTDEGTAPVALTVELDVPEVATLIPRSLEWTLRSPAVVQTVEIVVPAGLELVISHVQATSDAFTHRLESVEAGRHYRLHLAPRSTSVVANAAFRLHAKAATGEGLILSVYGNVR